MGQPLAREDDRRDGRSGNYGASGFDWATTGLHAPDILTISVMPPGGRRSRIRSRRMLAGNEKMVGPKRSSGLPRLTHMTRLVGHRTCLATRHGCGSTPYAG